MDRLPKDKEGHLEGGVIISVLVMLFSLITSCPFWYIAGPVAAISAGFIKEIIDLCSNVIRKRQGLRPAHSVEWLDFFYTTLGGLILPALIYKYRAARQAAK